MTITGTADQLEVRRPAAPQADDPRSRAQSATPIHAVGTDARVDTCDATRKDAGSLPTDANRLATSAADLGAHVGVSGANSSVPASAEIKTASKLDAAIRCTQARAALTGLGWKPAIARAAVDAAAAVSGPELTLERLIFESLRRCPTPKA
jgi:hypothetical protein